MLSRKYKVNKGFFDKKSPFLGQFSNQESTVKVFKVDSPTPLFGFIVSKKISPKAITRNLIKRRFSGIIERNLDRFVPNRAFIFYIKKEALECKFADLESNLLQLIQTIK